MLSTVAVLLWRARMLFVSSVLGFVFGPILTRRLAGIDTRRTRLVLLWGTVGALVGGHLHFLVTYGDVVYGERPWAALIPWGPLHAGGAVAGMSIAILLAVRRLRIPLGAFADSFAPTFGIGVAIARVGCWMQGCCYGAPSNCPWCPTFPPDSSVFLFQTTQHLLQTNAPHSLPAHPLQLYFVAAGLLVGVLALCLHPIKRYDGQVALVSFVVFAASSAFLEFFRADRPGRLYWGPLPQLEWVALALTAVGLVALLTAELAHLRRTAPVGAVATMS